MSAILTYPETDLTYYFNNLEFDIFNIGSGDRFANETACLTAD